MAIFWCRKNILDVDARVTSLDNIINGNPHIKEILWISEGMEAWMNNNIDGWQTGEAKIEE